MKTAFKEGAYFMGLVPCDAVNRNKVFNTSTLVRLTASQGTS
jgi:hypothetical protein